VIDALRLMLSPEPEHGERREDADSEPLDLTIV
jgi:hypothetical protein